jgi:VWFA-related protein
MIGRVRTGFAMALSLPAAMASAQPPPRFGERVEVERVLIDARVVDDRGDAIRDLTAADFRLRVDGRPVPIESVQWVSGPAPASETPRVEIEAPPGRLVVLLFQKDLEPSRATGLLKMIPRALGFLDRLGPEDRVAVLSFDSRLRPWTDFTADLDRVRRIVTHAVLFESGRPLSEGEPSLLANLDRDDARRAATIEEALELTARALEPLDGPKAIVLFGWGLGRFSFGFGVSLPPAYDRAREALLRARASVFVLDLTQADYHSLEVGLQQVAEDTGGFYAKTYLFPDQGMRWLAGVLDGYYVLSFEKPPGRRGRHTIDVGLPGRKGRVLARSAYEG